VAFRDASQAGHVINSRTIVVNLHGALLFVNRPLAVGTPVRIVNLRDESVMGHVIWTGDIGPEGLARVCIEFDSKVGPSYWGTMNLRMWEPEEKPKKLGLWERIREWFLKPGKPPPF